MARTLQDLQIAMANTMQSSTQTVLEHCLSVNSCFWMLVDHLQQGTEIPGWWKIPAWAKAMTDLLDQDSDTISEYLCFHDCGKPFCQTTDDWGATHFPNHARVSHDIWIEAGGSVEVALLMLHDMDFHTMRADTMEAFCSLPFTPTLMLAGLAEIHANAELFGGPDSPGFKIKCEHAKRRGGQAARLILKKRK